MMISPQDFTDWIGFCVYIWASQRLKKLPGGGKLSRHYGWKKPLQWVKTQLLALSFVFQFCFMILGGCWIIIQTNSAPKLPAAHLSILIWCWETLQVAYRASMMSETYNNVIIRNSECWSELIKTCHTEGVSAPVGPGSTIPACDS